MIDRNQPVKTADVALPLCEILGLNPSNVRSVEIRFNAGDLVVAHVELIPTEEQIRAIGKLAKGAEINVTSIADRIRKVVIAGGDRPI